MVNVNMSEIDLYKAFAASKPTQFDAFKRDWDRDHPQQEIKVEMVTPQIMKLGSLTDKAIEVEEEPKRKRKTPEMKLPEEE